MVLFEVWCSECNESHDPHTSASGKVREKITPGSHVWILTNSETRSEPRKKSKNGMLKQFRTRREKSESVNDVEKEWVKAIVVRRQVNRVIVKLQDALGSIRLIDLETDQATCLPANEKIVDDMADLHFTHKPAILDNLRERAQRDMPYTFIGNVLVSINPLHSVPEPAEESRNLNLPHPITVADRAYRKLCFAASQERRWNNRKTLTRHHEDTRHPVNQAIVISGQSGAGKTEAAKRVICYLIEREGFGDFGFDEDEDEDDVYDFNDRLVGSDPILESFGNATTLLNANSSRFGKFLKLNFKLERGSDDCQLTGASITTYLLEKSRVCKQEPGEKNFRVFYQLLTYANKKLHKHLGIAQANYTFNYLGGKKFGREDRDRIGFVELTTALSMAKLGVKNVKIFQLVACVLHLGNIEFFDEDEATIKRYDETVQNDDFANLRKSLKRSIKVNASSLIRSTFSSERNLSTRISFAATETNLNGYRASYAYIGRGTIGNQAYDPLKFAAKMLLVKTNLLEDLLLYKVIFVGGKRLKSPLTASAAARRRDAFAKQLYGLLFEYIVVKLNAGLTTSGMTTVGTKYGEDAFNLQNGPYFIGILDIFGFEHFDKNSFDQLLINYANEVMLSLFTRNVLIAESELYHEEGLVLQEKELTSIDDIKEKYTHCIKLFEEKDGLFSALDSRQSATQRDEKRLLKDIQNSCRKKNNPCYIEPHPSDRLDCFIIKHYAAEVKYTIGTFLEKNDFSLPTDVTQFFAKSGHVVVREFPDISKKREKQQPTKVSRRLRTKKTKTVSSIFQDQMRELRDTLMNTGCSYIRTIKPNPSLYYNPNDQDDKQVNAKMNKILSVVSVAQQGFQDRRKLSEYAAKRNLRNIKDGFERKLTTYAAKAHTMRPNKRYFDQKFVDAQLGNLGIYDAVSILKSGFPARVSYISFVDTFIKTLPLDEVDDQYFVHKSINYRTRMYVSALLQTYNVPQSSYRLGETRIFLEHHQLDHIKNIIKSGIKMSAGREKSSDKKRSKLKRRIQKFFERKRARLRRLKLFVASYFINVGRRSRASRRIQTAVRLYLDLKRSENRYWGAIIIQAHWRGFRARELHDELRIQQAQQQVELLLSAAQVISEEGDVDMESAGYESGNDVRDEYSEGTVVGYNNAMRNTMLSFYTQRRATTKVGSEWGGSSDVNSKLFMGNEFYDLEGIEDASDEEWGQNGFVQDDDYDSADAFDTTVSFSEDEDDVEDLGQVKADRRVSSVTSLTVRSETYTENEPTQTESIKPFKFKPKGAELLRARQPSSSSFEDPVDPMDKRHTQPEVGGVMRLAAKFGAKTRKRS